MHRRWLVIFPLFCLLSSTSQAQSATGYDVAREYIRHLAALHLLQNDAGKANPASSLSRLIEQGTRVSVELGTSVAAFQSMTATGDAVAPVRAMIETNTSKKELNDLVVEIMTDLISNQRTTSEIGAATAKVAKISGLIDSLDHTVFDVSTLTFLLLIDKSAVDSKGNLRRLNITKAQRRELITSINIFFADSLQKAKPNWIEAAAILMKTNLSKDWLSVDE